MNPFIPLTNLIFIKEDEQTEDIQVHIHRDQIAVIEEHNDFLGKYTYIVLPCGRSYAVKETVQEIFNLTKKSYKPTPMTKEELLERIEKYNSKIHGSNE